MNLCILGSGVGIPNVKRAYPGLLLKSESESILIDPGPGSLRQLLKAGFDYNDINVVILTHLHPDHCRNHRDIHRRHRLCRLDPYPPD